MKQASIFYRAITGLAFAVALTACNSNAEDNGKEGEDDKPEVAIPVLLDSVTNGDIQAVYSGTTSLEAEDQADVVAKVPGVVEKIFVEEGDKVEAGQPLAQLDTERLKLELARAGANLRKLENELERNKQVYEKKLISSDAFERMKYEFEAQKAAYDLAALEQKYGTIRAPIAGTISTRHIKTGNMIQANETAFTITDFDPLHAIIHVPERELAKLRLNQPAQVLVDALPGQIIPGFVKRISPVIDGQSGTFKVTVEVEPGDLPVRPGMFGRVNIVWATHADALLIPKNAVLSDRGEPAVFVIEDTIAKRKLVETGLIDGERIEVLSGLSAGEQVVTTGQHSLKEGTKVEILEF